MKIRPLEDRVVVQKVEVEEKVGDLYIPDAAKEKPMEGIVLAIGPGRYDSHGVLHKPELKLKDKVLFGKYSGTEWKVDGKDVLILRAEEILAVL